MSLLDTASLIVTPNGYKEGKLYSVIPSDGSGDMSVTRATTATRVNSAGLVELVPYNLLSYSQELQTATSGTITVTPNTTTAPDGTMTADSLSTGYLTKGVSASSGTYTFSTYAKYLSANTFTIYIYDGSYFTATYNVNTGVVTTSSSGVTASIEDAGNGWYRCIMTAATSNISEVGFNSGNIYAWGYQLVEGSTAKPYQKTETRLNIPRLDYSNGTCPSLLVEPQRTNLLTYSSSFDNAAWGKDTSVTITANYSASPSGLQDADRFQKNATSGVEGITQNQFGLASGAKAFSVYLKSNTGSNQNAFLLYANFQTQAITITSEWQRFDVVFNAITTVDYLGIVATSALDVSIWGAQLEVGSYPTSYIPTTSASVTRNADVISKTGISSLIGQTEGTMYLDFQPLNIVDSYPVDFQLQYNGSNSVNGVTIYQQGNIPTVLVRSGSSVIFTAALTATTAGTRNKIAIAYKASDFAVYQNGVQKATQSSGVAPAALNELRLSDGTRNYSINAAALWKTRLTNDELAALTTI